MSLYFFWSACLFWGRFHIVQASLKLDTKSRLTLNFWASCFHLPKYWDFRNVPPCLRCFIFLSFFLGGGSYFFTFLLQFYWRVVFAHHRRWIFGPSLDSFWTSSSWASMGLTVWSFTLSWVRLHKAFTNIKGYQTTPSCLTIRLVLTKERGLFRRMGELQALGIGAGGVFVNRSLSGVCWKT